ncbi:hypothetical protein DL98DRAFT_588452 [Cadophora sp. DSE1049]|nr:hypothetical protein DL98DRAFT_588452 [Cadophora sp. DSE1049]
MFATAHEAAQARLKKRHETGYNLELSSQLLPESYSPAQLYDELLGDGQKTNVDDDLPNLLILHSCLGTPRLQHEDDDEEYISKLSSWISKAILPTSDVATHDDAPEDSINASRQKTIHTARRRGALGLQSLLKLLTLPDMPQQSAPISAQMLISVIAFTSPRDVWSTPTSLTTAQQLLALPFTQSALQDPEFISTDVLQRFIRPLFSASKPRTVTFAGRKAIPSSAPLKRYDFHEERASKPWLYETVYAVTVLEWAVREISTTTLQATWPLILPPLLTLLDTPGTPILTRALPLITTLLPKLPPKTLAQTGLASVFSDAIIPVTLYLPSITPLEESLEILLLAYDALFVLYDVQFATPSTSTSSANSPTSSTSTSLSKAPAPGDQNSQNNSTDEARLTYLTLILRHSILPAYLHASQHPQITTILLTQLTTLIPKLGVHATKHLKDILPIISSVFTDLFASARLHDVLVALGTFRVLIGCCWARFREDVWRREGVRCLVLCWGAICEVEVDGDRDSGAQVDRKMLVRVKEELRVTGKVFAKAIEGGEVDLREELKPLLDVDVGVGEVFGV